MAEENDPIYKLPTEQTGLTEERVRAIISEMMGTWNEPAKMAGGYLQSANFVSGSQGYQLRPDGAEINGVFSVTQINIPDTTTASSFHVDSSGNAWWGANVASGYLNANAYILATGEAVFKNIKIGGTTIQYVITNSGIFSFGDGSDGNATCDGSTAVAGMSLGGTTYTMTRDVYFNNLTIDASITVNPAGYRIFVKDTLTVNGTINGDGPDGNDGAGGASSPSGSGSAAAGGTAQSLADGYLKGSVAPGAGGDGGPNETDNDTSGGNGTNTTNSLGSNATNGGQGGSGNDVGGTRDGAPGGTGGTRTLSNVKLIANWHLATLLDVASSGSTVKFDNSASGGGGGGGKGGDSGSCTNPSGAGGGGGGAGGTNGRIVAIYARTIVIGAAGSITANGGDGGDGGGGGTAAQTGCGTTTSGGGGGGGAGGNGGIIILVYNTLTNSGSITADAGAGGQGGAHGTDLSGFATDGTDGDAGAAGVIYQFQLSL